MCSVVCDIFHVLVQSQFPEHRAPVPLELAFRERKHYPIMAHLALGNQWWFTRPTWRFGFLARMAVIFLLLELPRFVGCSNCFRDKSPICDLSC